MHIKYNSKPSNITMTLGGYGPNLESSMRKKFAGKQERNLGVEDNVRETSACTDELV